MHACLNSNQRYRPHSHLQEIMDKYPPWLDRQTAAAGSSSSSLSAEELERYKAQYDCITRLVAAYEHEPDNTAKIMELLQEVRGSAAAVCSLLQANKRHEQLTGCEERARHWAFAST
jgi:hypothetical protein